MDKYSIRFANGSWAIIETNTNRWGIDEEISFKQFRDRKGMPVTDFADSDLRSVRITIGGKVN